MISVGCAYSPNELFAIHHSSLALMFIHCRCKCSVVKLINNDNIRVFQMEVMDLDAVCIFSCTDCFVCSAVFFLKKKENV
jgi:hypothetical protein